MQDTLNALTSHLIASQMRDLEAQLAQLKAFQREQALKLGAVAADKEALEARHAQLQVIGSITMLDMVRVAVEVVPPFRGIECGSTSNTECIALAGTGYTLVLVLSVKT